MIQAQLHTRLNGATGFRLTDRDALLLRDLYDSLVLSFTQVQARHFPGAAHSTVVNRLTRLKQAGLIWSNRVGLVIHHGIEKEIGVVYRISRRGLQKLAELHPDAHFRESPMPINSASLVHDLLLTDTVTALKKRFPDARFVNGRLLQGNSMKTARVPDAVLATTLPSERWAVELELSVKSARRYREIITSYRLSREYEKVLYVVGRRAIAETIQSQLLGFDVARSRTQQATGKFYFANLHELLASPAAIEVANTTRPGPSALSTTSNKGGES